MSAIIQNYHKKPPQKQQVSDNIENKNKSFSILRTFTITGISNEGLFSRALLPCKFLSAGASQSLIIALPPCNKRCRVVGIIPHYCPRGNLNRGYFFIRFSRKYGVPVAPLNISWINRKNSDRVNV